MNMLKIRRNILNEYIMCKRAIKKCEKLFYLSKRAKTHLCLVQKHFDLKCAFLT